MNFTEIDPGFLLPDEVWERVKAAIPPEPLKPKGGRPRMDDRKALNAMVYVLRTRCQWKVPRCLGASSTVHDRFQLWVEQGVFERMWELGLEQYAERVGIDWEWMAMFPFIAFAIFHDVRTVADWTANRFEYHVNMTS